VDRVKKARSEAWKEVWDSKALTATSDVESSGFENVADASFPRWVALSVIKVLDIVPTDRILEIGCNTGMIAKFISPFVDYYYGLDYSREAILRAERRNLERCSFFEREAIDLEDFKDKQFTKIFAHSVFQYFDGLDYAERVVNNALHLLKGGGKIAILDVPNIKYEAKDKREKNFPTSLAIQVLHTNIVRRTFLRM